MRRSLQTVVNPVNEGEDQRLLITGRPLWRGEPSHRFTLREWMATRLAADSLVVHAVHPGWADTPGVARSLRFEFMRLVTASEVPRRTGPCRRCVQAYASDVNARPVPTVHHQGAGDCMVAS